MLIYSEVAYNHLSKPNKLGYLQECDNNMDKSKINDVYYMQLVHVYSLSAIFIRAITKKTKL